MSGHPAELEDHFQQLLPEGTILAPDVLQVLWKADAGKNFLDVYGIHLNVGFTVLRLSEWMKVNKAVLRQNQQSIADLRKSQIVILNHLPRSHNLSDGQLTPFQQHFPDFGHHVTEGILEEVHGEPDGVG